MCYVQLAAPNATIHQSVANVSMALLYPKAKFTAFVFLAINLAPDATAALLTASNVPKVTKIKAGNAWILKMSK